RTIHKMAPGLLIWECDELAYLAGWLEEGVVCAPQIGTAAYLYDTPDNQRFRQYWELIWENKLADAIHFARSSGLSELREGLGRWTTTCPGRPDYFTHWGEVYR